MNLALPTLALFVLALPGLIFLRAYLRGTRGFPIRPRPLIEEVAYGVIIAILLHLLWLTLFSWVPHASADAEALGRILSGAYGNADYTVPTTIKAITAHKAAVFGYFSSLFIVSWLSGLVLHWAGKKWPAIRLCLGAQVLDHWHALLIDADFIVAPDVENPEEGTAETVEAGSLETIDPARIHLLAHVSAVVTMGQSDYLYCGHLESPKCLIFDAKGDLDLLVLSNPTRRLLSRDEDANEEESNGSRFYPIKGDALILRFCETRTLNVNYFALIEIEDTQQRSKGRPDSESEIESALGT